jgi:LPXTG-motif cell wall-anchored protein
MRRNTRGLLVVAWLALLSPAAAAPVGEEDAAPTVAVQRVNLPDTGLRDEASMMLVGVALIGLAGVVRRVV